MLSHRTLAAALLTLLAFAAPARAEQTNAPAAPTTAIKVEEIAKGLQNPWGMQVLPDGRLLVTERTGRMRLITKDGKISEPIAGLPNVVQGGQAGLFDVLLAPDFAKTGIIYFSYAEPRSFFKNGTSVAMIKLCLASTAACTL